ncbi:CIA30 family protein [Kordia sp. YSTF-M3]|uniref:CIA30 family protein n=1 Tax=Kordia aestuariivivens TaxID=2759037 RepID=A0ABR7QBU2_9FLAO|nr:CIA30 family protein [Kordia aestuariivivens]MBC8756031.1 CIA30 family protein [Kordia aestuariivivens]
MKKIYIISLLFLTQFLFAQQADVDFGKYKDGDLWRITDDGVMGGLSKGDYRFSDDGVVFDGTVSLENNGGFSSYKSRFKKTDLSSYTKVIIRYRSKNYIMGFTFEMDKRWYVPYYKVSLKPTDWKWVEAEIAFSEFDRYNIGSKRPGRLTQEELKKILRVGFTSNEKRAGDFKIEIDYIKFE